jgi:hypothetical protein
LVIVALPNPSFKACAWLFMASAGLATWAGLIPAVIITTAATHVAIPKCFNVFMFSPVEFEGINAVPVRKVQWI